MANVLPEGKWSKQYPKCQMCGTREIPHKADGLCRRCYLYLYKMMRRFGYATVRTKEGIMKRVKRTGKRKMKSSRPRSATRTYE